MLLDGSSQLYGSRRTFARSGGADSRFGHVVLFTPGAAPVFPHNSIAQVGVLVERYATFSTSHGRPTARRLFNQIVGALECLRSGGQLHVVQEDDDDIDEVDNSIVRRVLSQQAPTQTALAPLSLINDDWTKLLAEVVNDAAEVRV